MKHLFKLLLILTLFSCNKSNSNNSAFQGVWKGTYSGVDDNGTFIVSVDVSGNAKGTVTSIVAGETFDLTGTVTTAGVITLTFGTATSGGTFTGILKGADGSGTWENKMTAPTFTGTWTGHKQ